MKIIITYSLICLICLTSCQKCKKKQAPDVITISGTIYTDCYTVSKNTKYYRVYPFTNDQSEELITNSNGQFSFEVPKYYSGTTYISTNSTSTSYFCIISGNGSGENLDVGILRESANNQLILKLKTNHVLTSLDTIKYVFQYNTIWELINGPITKDTIIGTYTKDINTYSYNNSPSTGELKTLWWNFGQTTSSNQVRVDYTVHGCANVADTAYIVVP